jgi:hypothetical protein
MLPEEVLEDVDLTEQEKGDLLCELAYDAAEQAVASEEGMPGGDDDMQHSVLRALHQLHRRSDVEHVGPRNSMAPPSSRRTAAATGSPVVQGGRRSTTAVWVR